MEEVEPSEVSPSGPPNIALNHRTLLIYIVFSLWRKMRDDENIRGSRFDNSDFVNFANLSKKTTYIGWLTILANALSGAHLVEKYDKSGQAIR